MGEAVAPGSGVELPDQRRGLGGAEDVQHLVFGGPGRPDQQLEVEVAPDDRRHREDLGRGRTEPDDPRLDDLADSIGERHLRQVLDRHPPPGVIPVDGTRLGQVAQYLGDEERVAVGLAVDGVGQTDLVGLERLAGGGLHEVDHTTVVQPGQLDAGHAALAAEGAQGLDQRVA